MSHKDKAAETAARQAIALVTAEIKAGPRALTLREVIRENRTGLQADRLRFAAEIARRKAAKLGK